MVKKVSIVVLLTVLITLAQAHEFWMQPLKFFLHPGERTDVRFVVGENFIGESWSLKDHKVEKLDLHHGADVKSLLDSIKDAPKSNLSITVETEGTHLLALQSDNAVSELDAEKFNEYLNEDGLDDVLSHRKKTGTMNKPAREFYRRYAKLLVQVGNKRDDTFKKELGFPIEIIPEENPYLLKKGDPVRFKILSEGKPAFGVKVRVWNRYQNRTTIQNIYPEKNGVIETRISNPGAWMVSFVKMVPSKEAGAEWQSYWTSLTFGVE
jgi:uncharacterized GH25 family protein